MLKNVAVTGSRIKGNSHKAHIPNKINVTLIIQQPCYLFDCNITHMHP